MITGPLTANMAVILRVIHERPGITLFTISEKTSRTHGSVRGALKRLRDRGYIHNEVVEGRARWFAEITESLEPKPESLEPKSEPDCMELVVDGFQVVPRAVRNLREADRQEAREVKDLLAEILQELKKITSRGHS